MPQIRRAVSASGTTVTPVGVFLLRCRCAIVSGMARKRKMKSVYQKLKPARSVMNLPVANQVEAGVLQQVGRIERSVQTVLDRAMNDVFGRYEVVLWDAIEEKIRSARDLLNDIK